MPYFFSSYETKTDFTRLISEGLNKAPERNKLLFVGKKKLIHHVTPAKTAFMEKPTTAPSAAAAAPAPLNNIPPTTPTPSRFTFSSLASKIALADAVLLHEPHLAPKEKKTELWMITASTVGEVMKRKPPAYATCRTQLNALLDEFSKRQKKEAGLSGTNDEFGQLDEKLLQISQQIEAWKKEKKGLTKEQRAAKKKAAFENRQVGARVRTEIMSSASGGGKATDPAIAVQSLKAKFEAATTKKRDTPAEQHEEEEVVDDELVIDEEGILNTKLSKKERPMPQLPPKSKRKQSSGSQLESTLTSLLACLAESQKKESEAIEELAKIKREKLELLKKQNPQGISTFLTCSFIFPSFQFKSLISSFLLEVLCKCWRRNTKSL